MQRADSMKAYMQEIGEIPLISKEEEIELADRIRKGDEEAKHKLVQANLRLVVKIAHDFKGYGLPFLDLISEGNIGLMRAAEKFDPSKGAKFSSYSAWWIKQSMRRALSQKSRTIRVPVASASKTNKIRLARQRLSEELGREPTDEEVAAHLSLSLRTISSLKRADFKTFSLHDPVQKGEEGSFEELIADPSMRMPDSGIQSAELISRLRELLQRLDERERQILELRYGLNDSGEPQTLEEVSRIIGRTRERVRQIQIQAQRKLRAMLNDEQMEREEATQLAIAQGTINEHEAEIIPASIPSEQLSPDCFAYNREELMVCLTPLSALKLSNRCYNRLRMSNYRLISDVAVVSRRELLQIRYFGKKCYNELKAAIDSFYQRNFRKKKQGKVG